MDIVALLIISNIIWAILFYIKTTELKIVKDVLNHRNKMCKIKGDIVKNIFKELQELQNSFKL